MQYKQECGSYTKEILL